MFDIIAIEALQNETWIINKKPILLILTWTIILGGLFFDVHETLERSDHFSLSAEANSDSHSVPLCNSLNIKSRSSFIVSVSEVRDARIVKEVMKQFKKNSKGSHVIIPVMLLFFGLSVKSIYSSVLPTVCQLTNFIFSRRSIISYIQNQDDNK